ncbi:putative acyl-CoA dehydrogenase [Exidia glandulosa HHB12029]|uniref:Putative acyl-CoA dehydrogenase n=1 Tax=Exidia glandulosa HHB12029 TaxID=1314781 RepID=A0A165F9M4_EXIGL|nr:putative acyl-CoA dehydrogenase [Exidia glandulosa HHB12029]
MVDFTLSPAEATVRDTARVFAKQHLSGAKALYCVLPSNVDRFQAMRPIYEEAVRLGLVRAMIPPALGGSSGSLLEMTLTVEECYAVDPTASLTIFATGLGLTPLLSAWRPGLEEFLQPFLKPEGAPLASLVFSEPGGVANWLEPGAPGLQTTAHREGDEWVLSGEKIWATNSAGWDFRGPDLGCVVCRCTDADIVKSATTPADLIMILIVTRDDIERARTGSFEVLRHPDMPGHTAVSGPHIRFDQLRLPAKNLLCPPGTGAPIVNGAFTMSACLVGAMGTGLQRAIFDAALTFARTQTRGGSVPIIQHQSVANLLIDIKMRTETSRYLTWKSAHCLVSGPGMPDQRRELALEAKIYCSDAAVKSAMDAINLVGISAYDTAAPFTSFLNDAMVLPIFDGGNVGIRRRDLQSLFMSANYDPWATSVE